LRQLFDCSGGEFGMWDSFKQSSSSVDIERDNRSTPWTVSRAIQAANLHALFAAINLHDAIAG
jgi:hypothetical protein